MASPEETPSAKARRIIERGLTAYSLSDKEGLSASFALESGTTRQEDAIIINPHINGIAPIKIDHKTGEIDVDGQTFRNPDEALKAAKDKIKTLLV